MICFPALKAGKSPHIRARHRYISISGSGGVESRKGAGELGDEFGEVGGPPLDRFAPMVACSVPYMACHPGLHSERLAGPGSEKSGWPA